MRALTRTEPGRLEWTSAPDPKLQGPGEAIVRPVAVTLCDIDRPMVDGRFPVPGSIHLGHEFVAEVTEVGDAVRSVRPGDRVCVPFQISCGRCDRCRAGLTAHCRAVRQQCTRSGWRRRRGSALVLIRAGTATVAWSGGQWESPAPRQPPS